MYHQLLDMQRILGIWVYGRPLVNFGAIFKCHTEKFCSRNLQMQIANDDHLTFKQDTWFVCQMQYPRSAFMSVNKKFFQWHAANYVLHLTVLLLQPSYRTSPFVKKEDVSSSHGPLSWSGELPVQGYIGKGVNQDKFISVYPVIPTHLAFFFFAFHQMIYTPCSFVMKHKFCLQFFYSANGHFVMLHVCSSSTS